MLYGEGGSGKSYLALIMCLAITFGITIAGLSPKKGRVMYLDYETSQGIIEGRLRKLARSLDLGLDDPMVLYYRGTQTMVRDAQSIKANILNNHIDHLVIDSASLAVGGKLEDTEAVGAFFAALRTIGISSTLITHVAKNTSRAGATPFGSTYWRNFTRSEWQVIGSQAEGSPQLSMLVKHTKVNDEARHNRLGFTFHFGDDTVRVTPSDPDTLPGLEKQAPLRKQIEDAIDALEGKATLKAISVHIGATGATVETTIRRNPGTFMRVGVDGRAVLYGVKSVQYGDVRSNVRD